MKMHPFCTDAAQVPAVSPRPVPPNRAVAFAVSLAFAPLLGAQPLAVDPDFAPVLTHDGTTAPAAVQILKLTAGADGSVAISGVFTHVNGQRRPGLARLHADGSLDASFAPVRVAALEAVQPDGRILVAMPDGSGTGDPPILIQRLLADGSTDPSLPPDSDLALSGGHVVAVDPAGNIYASAPTGVTAERVFARFAPDGRQLAACPFLFQFRGAYPAAEIEMLVIGVDPEPIEGVQPLPDGGVLVGGLFVRLPGAAIDDLVRLRVDLTVDTGYRPVLPRFAHTDSAMPLSGGRALLRLYRWIPGGGSDPFSVRLLADGSIDPAFRPPPGEVLFDATEQPDGSFLAAGGELQRWSADGVRDLNVPDLFAGSSSSFLHDAARLPDGRIYLGGRFDVVAGQARTGLARLVPVAQPGITVQPQPQTVVAGRRTFFQVAIGDLGDATYQWQRNGDEIAGATGPVLVLDPVRPAGAGEYRAVVTVGGHVYVSDAVTLTVLANTARLANFSARTRLRTGDPPQIGGFVTAGGPRPVLLRAAGPSIPGLFPTQVLRDPKLALFNGAELVAQNDNWGNDPLVEETARRVWAFPFRRDSLDAALVRELGSGSSTVHTDGAEGIALFEFYDAGEDPATGFVRNASLRGRSAPGDGVLIAGFVVEGTGPLTLLIRGVGPELARWEVPDTLADPRMSLFAGSYVHATNDDWDDDPAEVERLRAATEAVHAFALDDGGTSAALLVTFEPGVYTVHVAGGEAAPAGEALVELYVVDD